MKLVKDIIEQTIREQICKTPFYKKCTLVFCDTINIIEYFDYTETQQQFCCHETANKDNTPKNTIKIKIMVVGNSQHFNNCENIKNKTINFPDGEVIILPNMRVFIQTNNDIFVVAREYFVIRELYNLLPYIYYKMGFFDTQPLILHACAVNVVDNNTCVFLGKSGAGKTTTAKLACQSGLKVLSDELICITEKSCFKVNGTNISSSNYNETLHNEEDSTLSAFCIIEKHSSFQMYKCPDYNYKKMLSSAVENSVFTNDILLTIFKLCHTIQFVHMRFYKDFIDWETIKQNMEIQK